MFWIHGGGLVDGSPDLYNGESLFRVKDKEVIVVTINYRLGYLGFFVSDEVENDGGGFYGILDQRFALEWVKKNIEVFGGNKNNVIVFGESAGAISISAHLVSPGSRGLFHKAILQSGTFSEWSETTGKNSGANLLRATNCQNVACLRTKTVQEIVSAQNTMFFPTVLKNSRDFPLSVKEALSKGEFYDVPTLIGTNENEMSFFLCRSHANLTVEGYLKEINDNFRQLAPLVLRLYPVNNYSNPTQALIDLQSDIAFKCPSKLGADLISKKEKNTFFYSFEQIPGFSNTCFKVAHAYELPYLFDRFLTLFNYRFTPIEQMLSDKMVEHWVHFAYSDYSQLKPYNSAQSNYISYNTRITEKTQFRESYCRFWNQIRK